MDVLLKRWVLRDGERIRIAEIDARMVPGASRASCLICECEQSIRRIWSFPDDWNRMDDAALMALFNAPQLQRDAPMRKEAPVSRSPRLESEVGTAR